MIRIRSRDSDDFLVGIVAPLRVTSGLNRLQLAAVYLVPSLYNDWCHFVGQQVLLISFELADEFFETAQAGSVEW